MTSKRQATTELNRDNWDEDDPVEEMGTFNSASKDILEKRVIRTAKRRTQTQPLKDEAKKSVFSGFGGFNKAQPSSFEFLGNLTNGSKPTNGTSSGKSDDTSTSSLFTSKPASSGPSAGLFSTPVSSSPSSKPTPFGLSLSTPTTSLFGSPPSNSTAQLPFGTSNKESTVTESPFKIQTMNTIEGNKVSPFGNTNSMFSNTNQNSSPFAMSNNNPTNNSGINKQKNGNDEENKLKYYAKLKGLNESVSDWIKKHVEETPLCILTPIFNDYEKHLKSIQEEYQGTEQIKKVSDKTSSEAKSPVKEKDVGSSLFSNTETKPTTFCSQTADVKSGEKASGFTFGINTSSVNTTTSAKFSFGINTAPQTTVASSSPFTSSTNSGPENKTPFSFGMGKPFSFSSNIQKPAEQTQENNEEDEEPPKVEFTPVVEENSVFDKRCKIFVKKDGNFVDKGLGTLYIKKIEESGKHQLLVRANTNLGTILLNLILTSGIPTQRLGKNNVMLVCIPTPDAKPPPSPVLIRVKTSEEADDLLETLNKYKA